MVSCKETAQLISESLDRPLSWHERVSVRLHTLLCDMCTRYARQLRFLKNVCADADPEQTAPPARLDEEARERIGIRLNQGQ